MSPRWFSLFFSKVVRIDFLDLVRGDRADAHAVLNHEVGKFLSVNEDDLLLDARNIISSVVSPTLLYFWRLWP